MKFRFINFKLNEYSIYISKLNFCIVLFPHSRFITMFAYSKAPLQADLHCKRRHVFVLYCILYCIELSNNDAPKKTPRPPSYSCVFSSRNTHTQTHTHTHTNIYIYTMLLLPQGFSVYTVLFLLSTPWGHVRWWHCTWQHTREAERMSPDVRWRLDA